MENEEPHRTWRRFGRCVVWLAWLNCLAGVTQAAVVYVGNSQIGPPAPPREFRGLWVATVKDLDWPSRPGLTSQQQKAELIELLERARQLRFNAIFFQVRPSCDALYEIGRASCRERV